MAKGRSPRVPGGAALPAASDRDRILDAALQLIAETGWRRLSMAAVAAAAGMPLVRVYREYPSRLALLCAFYQRIDETVLALPVEAEEGERPRDRVFDLLMRRFDALGPYRSAIEVLGRELPTEPPAALAAGLRLLRSVAWVLEAAGIATGGWRGAVAIKLTAGVYLATLRGWLRDETPDLGPTMAALDRRLRSIERWYDWPRQTRPDAAAAR